MRVTDRHRRGCRRLPRRGGDRLCPPPRSRRTAPAGARGGGGAEHRGIGLTGDDARPLGAQPRQRRDQVAALAAGEERDRDCSLAREPAGEARVVRGRGQRTPDHVEEVVAVAGRTPDRSDPAGLRGIRALVRDAARAPSAPTRITAASPGPPATGRACRADDDRRSAAGDGAGSGASGARLVGVEAEQEAETQRIREDSIDAPAAATSTAASAPNGSWAALHLVDDRERPVEAIPDQDAVVAVDDGAGNAPAALAGVTQPGRRGVEVLGPDHRDHLAVRGRTAEVIEPRQLSAPTPEPDGVWLAGRAIAVRSRASSSLLPSSSRSV